MSLHKGYREEQVLRVFLNECFFRNKIIQNQFHLDKKHPGLTIYVSSVYKTDGHLNKGILDWMDRRGEERTK